MSFATLFDQVATLTSPGFIWSLYGFILLLSIMMSVIFFYHWFFFHANKPLFILASTVYFIGLTFILITLFITLNLTLN